MMLRESTELTAAQHRKLDTIAKSDPEAKVIDHLGRYEDYFMPIILRGDGRTQKLQPGGRLTPFKE